MICLFCLFAFLCCATCYAIFLLRFFISIFLFFRFCHFAYFLLFAAESSFHFCWHIIFSQTPTNIEEIISFFSGRKINTFITHSEAAGNYAVFCHCCCFSSFCFFVVVVLFMQLSLAECFISFMSFILVFAFLSFLVGQAITTRTKGYVDIQLVVYFLKFFIAFIYLCF